MNDLRTCRFCGMSNYEHRHPAADSAWVKYGPRHSAHLKCGVEQRGESFIRSLPTHRLEQLPIMEIVELGMRDVLQEEMDKRRNNTGNAA